MGNCKLGLSISQLFNRQIMKDIFDAQTREEIINRIQSLTEQNPPHWGRMNVHQMIKHCIMADEHFLGKRKHKRAPLGYVFGKLALKNILKKERPFKPGTPTSSAFLVQDTGGDLTAEKQQWINTISEYGNYKELSIIHWFFGRMNRNQIGQFAYKHADHHLRQFGV